jgi:CMP-N,N'-diacetyllegionaminic acid synthase
LSVPPSVVALVPARAGSKRVPGKNVRYLCGHPVLAYAIRAAIDSGVFSAVIVSTDSPEYAEIAAHYGADVPFLRPAEIAGDLSPDIEWVEHVLRGLRDDGRACDCFSILRPTNPFRSAETIRRAWNQFCSEPGIDSLRAVEPCKQHPGKMWLVRGRRMLPLLPFGPPELPWHSSQYPALPEIYVQNASLEIAWCRVVFDDRTIAGEVLMPFFTHAYEGFDLNHPLDFRLAEELIATGAAVLPPIGTTPFAQAHSRMITEVQ